MEAYWLEVRLELLEVEELEELLDVELGRVEDSKLELLLELAYIS